MQRKVKDRVKNKNKENKVKGISIEFKKKKMDHTDIQSIK